VRGLGCSKGRDNGMITDLPAPMQMKIICQLLNMGGVGAMPAMHIF
jgi:hypothetical protein